MSKELDLIAAGMAATSPTSTERFGNMSQWNQQRWLSRAAHVVSKLSEHGYSIVPSDPGTCVDDPMGTHRWMPTNYPWQWCPDCSLRKHDAFAAAEGES